MRTRLATALVVPVILAGCSPTAPLERPPVLLRLTCPADITVSGVTGSSTPVNYPAPVSDGGTAPVQVTCAPASGTAFPLGASAVSCEATDAGTQRAMCAFAVTLAPARLGAARFVTFGDSMTEGQNGQDPGGGECPTGLFCIDTPHSYPTDLKALLSSRYPVQSFEVINEGVGGERASAGVNRLPGVLTADRPDVLVLLQGINDLNGDGAAAVPVVLDALRTDIRNARAAGVQYVFVSTLLPERPGGSPPRGEVPELVAPANDLIRPMVTSEGAVLVDGYAAFGATPNYLTTLINTDGLHLTPAGNQVLAQAFYDAIVAKIPTIASLRRVH